MNTHQSTHSIEFKTLHSFSRYLRQFANKNTTIRKVIDCVQEDTGVRIPNDDIFKYLVLSTQIECITGDDQLTAIDVCKFQKIHIYPDTIVSSPITKLENCHFDIPPSLIQDINNYFLNLQKRIKLFTTDEILYPQNIKEIKVILSNPYYKFITNELKDLYPISTDILDTKIVSKEKCALFFYILFYIVKTPYICQRLLIPTSQMSALEDEFQIFVENKIRTKILRHIRILFKRSIPDDSRYIQLFRIIMWLITNNNSLSISRLRGFINNVSDISLLSQPELSEKELVTLHNTFHDKYYNTTDHIFLGKSFSINNIPENKHT